MRVSLSKIGSAATVVGVLAALGIGGIGGAAAGERTEPLPDDLEGVGITEHLGTELPLHLSFTDDRGKAVLLSDYFDGRRPFLLTLNYSSCPMLCSLQLNALVEGMSAMKMSIADEFEVLTVSIDPTESTTLARQTKQRYLRDYAREGADVGWHFLTGDEQSIHALADAVGFGYRRVENTGEYAHSAVTFVITPDGVVSRYLYGVVYGPQTLRLSLVEASEGTIGSTIDRVLLFCFHYDASKGRYGPAAERLMRAGGFMTVLVLGVVMTRFWRRERRGQAT